jgi:hypothetical protein
MDPAPVPEDGDIVVRHEMRDSTRIYVLHTARGSDQILYRTRDAAIAQAVAFAKQHHVRVWIGTPERDYTLLENFRRVETS